MSIVPRIGVGVDVHAFAAPSGENRPFALAGLLWPDAGPGLAGHSDGDAAAHAAADALLNASGLGDLGQVLGVDEPAILGISGCELLARVVQQVRAAGFEIGNIGLQIIGNRPRLAPRREEAQEVLSQVVGAPVHLSATTTDGLGLTGRGEGVAAIATAVVWKSA